MKQLSTAPLVTLLNTTVVGQPWHKHYRLGLGVDAVTGQIRASAVEPFEVKDEPQMSPTYIYSLVQSESDISSMISGSAQGSYNMEGVTVSAGTSFLDALTVSELSVTLVAQVTVNRSQYSLAPSYKLSVTPGPDFRDKYGDYFVAGYRAASSLYVVYQCKFSTVEQRSKFTATLAAEVPQVMTTKGSTEFEKTAKESSATVSIRISAHGVSSPIPSPPESGWTPANIVAVLLPWFEKSMALDPLETYLMHYRVIDPSLSGEVPISPYIFSQLAFLYDRFWLARAHYHTCPDFGRRLVDEPYKKLEKAIEANQASLPSDEANIESLTKATQELLQTFHEISNRQLFFTQVVAASRAEPAKDQNFDADKGTVRWGYGFQRSTLPGVVVSSLSDSVAEDWKIGWREHVFSYRDSTRLLVGFDITCNRNDGFGGDWHKASDHVIGQSAGDVYVKSDYDRGYSWTIIWYSVDASSYPRPTGGAAPAEDLADETVPIMASANQ
jgi:hypothetical protein